MRESWSPEDPEARERVRRLVRIYQTSKDAARAVGLHPNSMRRIMQAHGVQCRGDRPRRGARR